MDGSLTRKDFHSSGRLNRLGAHIALHDTISSTNDWLKARAGELPDGTIVAAEMQTAGRGRRGRAWLAPRGSSVLMSVLLIESIESPLPRYASLLAAVSVARAVRTETGLEARIRWPNDLTLGGRKFAGVLVETTVLAGRGRAVIVGIGINCLQQKGQFPPELSDKATSLEIESGRPVRRDRVAAGIVGALDEQMARVLDGANVRLMLEEWRRLCADWGARATLIQDSRTYQGTIADVTETGDLIVQLDDGRRAHFEAASTTRSW